MRLGIVSDVHGNAVALDAVLAEARGAGIDRWLVLGDLVLFGPRPAEVLDTLRQLPGVAFVGGNTDRYIVTGEQPAPHATPEDVVGASLDIVERYGLMAAGIGWARGALCQAGSFDWLTTLPPSQRVELSSECAMLAVHATPGADDGPGIDPDRPDDELAALLAGCDEPIVVGGHTHAATDRRIGGRPGGLRVLNPGSVGLPRRCAGAAWIVIDSGDGGDGSGGGGEVTVEQRFTPFDVEAVVGDLHARRQPNADFVTAILRRQHPYAH